MIEKEVEHATCLSLADGAIETWQTWEEKIFLKKYFSLKLNPILLKLKQFCFLKSHFLLKQNQVLKTKIPLFFKTSLQLFLFFKILFSFRASSSWDFNVSLSLETHPSLTKPNQV